VIAPAFQQPRWIHTRDTAHPVVFVPWLEVSALVRVRVEEWQHDDRLWVHWAVACPGGAPRLDAARPFDPGRRAGQTGEPSGIQRRGTAPHHRTAVEAAQRLLADWRPLLHRQGALGLVSRPDEPVEQFRHRCLGALGPAIRSGGLRGDGAQAALARLAGGIESRTLGPAELEAESLQVRVAWYAEGDEPALAGADLLVDGTARQAE
jgi:hypothetical protein